MTVKNNQLEFPYTSADKSKLDAIEDGAKTYSIATQLEAQAGVDNVKLMTPLRVAQAISALGGGGGSGEVNTASNLGTGIGIFKQKTGVNLEFKSLVAGTGVTLTPGANSIVIDVSAGGLSTTDQLAEGSTHLYYTDSRVTNNSAVQANTAKVSASGSINTHNDVAYASPTDGQVLTWDASLSKWVNANAAGGGGGGTVTGGANVGSTAGNTAGVFKSLSSATMQFKRLIGGSNVTITDNTNDITIAAAGAVGHLTQYLIFDSGNIVIRASGSSADLASITATKDFSVSATSRLVLNRPSTVQYHSAVVTFTAAETSGRTQVNVEVPDPNGATVLNQAIRPIAYRLNPSYNVAATGGTIALTGSTVVLTQTGYTAGAEQRMVVQF